jgi:putative ABC transport system permease protein
LVASSVGRGAHPQQRGLTVSLWRQLTHGLRALTRRESADRNVADEVDHYFEQATEAYESQGLSPSEARRAARLELGSTTSVREQIRASAWEHAVETLFIDMRYGARRLRTSPGFTAIGVLTLALGIGASSAIFSAVNPILVEPLPYPQARRVVMIWDKGPDGVRQDVTFGTYREVVERSRSFERIAVMRAWQPTLTDGGEPERLDGQRVSADYFRVVGVLPALGRNFEASDDLPNGPRVAIISGRLWHRRFGGDRTILNRQITLDDSAFTVIGVMPIAFENVLTPTADVWRPLQYDIALPPQGREWGHHLRMVSRLKPDAGIDRAARELDLIARTPVKEFSRPQWASLASGLIVNSLQDDVTRGVKPALLAVVGAVLLVLSIACVNVTNLLLARGAQRRGEFAMRAALGAARPRLIRQLITESLMLAFLGGALGLVVAVAGARAMLMLAPSGLPRASAISIDGAVFAFAFGITALIGLIVGLVPALDLSRRDLHAGIQQNTRTTGGYSRTRHALVVAEVALAVMLLVSAGLLLRTVRHLFAIDPGFDATGLLTMQVQTSGRRFDDAANTRFFADALDAVRQVAGVSAVAVSSQLPLSGDHDVYGVHFESSPTRTTDEDRGAFRYAVSPGYFEAMRIALRSGRLLEPQDGMTTGGAPLAVVINESFAKRRFPGRDSIGQHLRIGPDSGPWFTIVGIVGDVKQTSLAVSQADAVYMTTAQWHSADRALWLVVRAQGEPAALTSAVKNAIWSVDKNQPIVRVATMNNLLAASVAERRFALTLFEAFGVVALLLAAIGIYGLLSGSVTERTREIGVRAALGASRARLMAAVVREGMILTGLGVVIGLAAATVATGVLVTLLFGVTPVDTVTYAGVVAMLFVVSAIACAVPAGRAACVDPAITLRAE